MSNIPKVSETSKTVEGYLRRLAMSSPLGLFFSESGKLNICKRFGLKPNELEAAIESVRSEAVGHGK